MARGEGDQPEVGGKGPDQGMRRSASVDSKRVQPPVVVLRHKQWRCTVAQVSFKLGVFSCLDISEM